MQQSRSAWATRFCLGECVDFFALSVGWATTGSGGRRSAPLWSAVGDRHHPCLCGKMEHLVGRTLVCRNCDFHQVVGRGQITLRATTAASSCSECVETPLVLHVELCGSSCVLLFFAGRQTQWRWRHPLLGRHFAGASSCSCFLVFVADESVQFSFSISCVRQKKVVVRICPENR